MRFFKKKKIELKKKVKPKKIEHNCSRDGHLFKILCFHAKYTDKDNRPTSPCFMAECDICKERKTSIGNFWVCLPMWWENKLISLKTYNSLHKKVKEYQEKIQKEFDDNLKTNKKSKKK